MATFNNNFYGGYTLRIDYTVNSQSVANNTSNVTVKAQLVSSGSGWNIISSTSRTGTLTINGTSYTFTCNVGLNGGETKTLFTKTVDIPHNADGTKTCSMKLTVPVNATLSGTYYGTQTVSGNATFTTIPRKTSISISGASYKFGSAITISHARASTAFTVSLRYTCGSKSGSITSKAATNSTSWTPPLSLQSEIPKAKSILITIYCDTYNGDTIIGTTSTSYTCNIADSCVPSITGGSFTNPDTSGTTYWQSVSCVRAEFTVSLAYGATISKWEMSIDNQTIVNYGYIIWSPTLTSSGNKDIKLTVTDSRGMTATKTWTSAIYVTPYNKPNISSFTCKRTGINEDTGGEELSNLGTNGYFSASGTFHTNATNRSRKFMYKPVASSTWTTITIGDEDQTDLQFSTSLSSGSAYDLKYVMTDNVSSTEMQITMQNLFPLINLSADGTSIAFGKEVVTPNRFAVEMDATFSKWCGINSLEVTGSALMHGTLSLKGVLRMNDMRVLSADNNGIYVNSSKDFASITMYGATTLQDRGNNLSLLRIVTSGDANGNGDGNTLLGYYQSENGGYGHYFRGNGKMHVDCKQGITVAGNIATSAKLYTDFMVYRNSGGWTDADGLQTWGVGCDCHFLPVSGTRYVGTAAHRWQQLYCVTAPNVSSDARMKENVKYMYDKPEILNELTDVKDNDEITTKDLLDFVLNDLYMVTFDYKQNTEGMEEGEVQQVTAMNNRQIGFIAQDIENTKVGRYLVSKDSEGILGYESSNWPSIIAGALQQEIRDRQAADKELMDMLNSIINE